MPRQRGVVHSMSGLKDYFAQLKRNKIQFSCPRCEMILLSKDFQNHCSQQHQLNSLRYCVWCWGEKSWPSGAKNSQVDHMTQCWKKFMARHAPIIPQVPIPVPPSTYRPDAIAFDLTPMCPKEDLFGHEDIPLDRLHDPIWPVPLGPNLLTFSDDGLNLAAACVQLYLQFHSTMDFFHVMVRLVGFPSFVKAMDEDQGVSRTLPFSTLCNGSQWREARHRQHRHMIVVSPKRHFERHVWSKVRILPEDRPSPQYKCKWKSSFQSLMHFIHTLGYLSKRESICDFSCPDEEAMIRETTTLNHFWIFTPLPKDYRILLATQWDNGILDLLNYLYTDFSVDQLLQFPLDYIQQKWRLKIKYLPGIPLGLVLPVSQDLRPCSYPTSLYLHLIHGEKMYFERDARPDTWLAEQVQHGNLFYHVVAEEYFTLRKKNQQQVHWAKPVFDRNQELVNENNQLCERIQELVKENNPLRERIQELVKENNPLREKIQELLAQNTQYAQQVHRLQRQVRCEKRKVQRWIGTANYWKKHARKWRMEKDHLQTKILRLYEEENARLKAENTQLKEEIAQRRRV